MVIKSVLKGLFFFLLTMLVIQQWLIMQGCANIIPPEGGPRDSLPPVLKMATPPDSTINFDKKTITFTFNEYIELDEIQKNLIISPVPEKAPNVEAKLKELTVKLKDSLEPNTTYVIEFGKAIQDINERNKINNFTYIFTTGEKFDSLTFSGKVILAETGKTDTSLTVMLHRSAEDSALTKEKPRYITRLNNKGEFRFRFLPPGIYYVYTLKDEGGQYKYFGGEEQVFGFAKNPAIINDTAQPITIYAYGAKKTAPTVTQRIPVATGADDKNKIPRLIFNTNLGNATQQDLLKEFNINFQYPITNFDSSKLSVYTDTSYIPLAGYRWLPDSTNISLTLKTPWKENTPYNIIFDKEFAVDSLGRKLLKTDTVSFTTKQLSDYGSLKINFKNLDVDKNPVVQLMKGDNIESSYPLTSATLVIPMLIPSDYNISILYDDNKNGEWDPGEFFGKRKQPELVLPIDKKLTVRASWDNEFDIDILSKPQPPKSPEGGLLERSKN